MRTGSLSQKVNLASLPQPRVPILLGILLGMLVWIGLLVWGVPVLIWEVIHGPGDHSTKALSAARGYYCIHRTLLLGLCAIGGAVGVACSEWSKVRSLSFLLGMLLLIAGFAALFPR